MRIDKNAKQYIDPGLLKAMILTALHNSQKNSLEIYDHITGTPYKYPGTVTEHAGKYNGVVYKGTIQAMRTNIVYMFKAGFIRKERKTRMLIYSLTALGNTHYLEPFKDDARFNDRVNQAVEARLKSLPLPVTETGTVPAETPETLPVPTLHEDTQHIGDERIAEHSIINTGPNCTLNVLTGGKPIQVVVKDGIPSLSDEVINGDVIRVNAGLDNNVGLNVSNDPGKRELIGMKVTNGHIQFDT